MTTTTALLVLTLVLLTALIGGVLFHLAFTRPRLAVPLSVAMAGMTLLATCAMGIVTR
ncbi:hypothetical protein OG389_16135 [Streptomyces sp. NBC_00435]|uniref:hypothetical protein n=1 Tax=Streptomyces sp. NBC_00435 TaxID=2903649 RepID=UPI002E2080FA